MERLTEKTGTGYERKDIQVKNQQLIDNLAAYEEAEAKLKEMEEESNVL